MISAAASAGCRQWQAPEVASGGSAGAIVQPPTAERVEEIQRQAYDEAFERGRREGLAEGRRQAAAEAKRLAAMLDLLGEPLRELDERVVEEMAALALAIARHLVRREIRVDPTQIVAVVREAVAALPGSARRVRVMLHPDDAAVLREALNTGESERGAWQIVEDPALQRGGCRVETEHSRIDASIERRLAAIAAELLGGERGSDDVGGH